MKVRDKLIFLHIPKTAGTSLFCAMKDAYKKEDPSSLFFYTSEFEDFIPNKFSLLAGHFHYNDVFNRYPDSHYLTVFREPCSRLLSLWLFWRTHEDSVLSENQEAVKISRFSLVEFLSNTDIALSIDNSFVRSILNHPEIPKEGFIDPANDEQLFSEAIKIIDKFDFVDFIENPDFCENLEKFLGISIFLGFENKTNPIPKQYRSSFDDEFNQRAFFFLKMRTRLDFKIWEYILNKKTPKTHSVSFQEKILSNYILKCRGILAGYSGSKTLSVDFYDTKNLSMTGTLLHVDSDMSELVQLTNYNGDILGYLSARLTKKIDIFERFDIPVSSEKGALYLKKGFSFYEPWGCWCKEHKAKIEVPVNVLKNHCARLDILLEISAYYGVIEKSPVLKIIVNEKIVCIAFFRKNRPDFLNITFSVEITEPLLTIDFEFTNLESPSLVGSLDTRMLGFSVQKLCVHYSDLVNRNANYASELPVILGI